MTRKVVTRAGDLDSDFKRSSFMPVSGTALRSSAMSVGSVLFTAFLCLLLFNEITCTDWNSIAKDTLKNALKIQPNTGFAKNVIVFIGDGMGLSTINAARILKGQTQNHTGEETILEFEKFPHVAFSKVYGSDRQVPESAQTATAILGGVKTNCNMVGLKDSVRPSDCNAQSSQGKEAEVQSIVRLAINQGKSTGVVTTTRITHATPAAAYAHSAHRDWESDANMNATLHGNCKDIAWQLINNNHDIQVVLGGGRRGFLPVTEPDPETNSAGVNKRLDGLNLIETWKTLQQGKNKRHSYVWRKQEFDAVNENDVDYLLGLFSPSHMEYEVERNKGPSGEPSLSEMTSKAIKILKRNSNGFVLVVEGGRIDHAHHDNLAKKALTDAIELEEAVKMATSLTNEQDTLIIVTADHSHPFSLTGYTVRGNDVLGLVDADGFKVEPATDKLPYTSLLYANGPGYGSPRQNLTGVRTDTNDYLQQTAVPMAYETHSGEDVGIFARGPMSHLFHGVHEQHYIAHVMQYAACLGDYKNDCDRTSRTSGASMNSISLFIIMACFLLVQ